MVQIKELDDATWLQTWQDYSNLNAVDKVYEVSLDLDEHLTDDILSLIPNNSKYIIITRRYETRLRNQKKFPTDYPIKILCSAEGLGRINPIIFQIQWAVDGLDSDDIFSKCSKLEMLYIGGNPKGTIIFESFTNIMRLPLKVISLQGYGTCNISDTFKKFLEEGVANNKFKYTIYC